MKSKNRLFREQELGNRMEIAGEAGRPRVSTQTTGMRQVRIFKGPRDNYDEVMQEYTDEAGAIRGRVAVETANSVILEYPKERFLANQRAAEEIATSRVARAAPVGDGMIDRNVVGRGAADTLEAHLEAARGDAGARFDG